MGVVLCGQRRCCAEASPRAKLMVSSVLGKKSEMWVWVFEFVGGPARLLSYWGGIFLSEVDSRT